MAVCPFCGCKTDELDFVLCKVENTEAKVCSFCDKQIKKIDTDENIATAQLRWLESIVSKDIVRDKNITDAINSLKSKYLEETKAEEIPATFDNQFAEIKKDVKTSPVTSGRTSEISAQQYNDLVKRLEKLEKSFATYKKTQLIKMIIELGLPVVLLIIILIVLLTSGVFDMLSNFSNFSQ
ncbi:MAG: hypothetical protein IJN49_03435 [Clostridia bacterium]|nr:hypothetical protein [Clostridia bacterium]